jgi:chromosome segregation ATPase
MRLTTGILGLCVAASLFSCDKQERAQLQRKVDSLTAELQASKQTEQVMSDVGVLIDSIDASRRALRSEMVEGTSYADYITRLKEINKHLKDTEQKVAQMEQAARKDKGVSRAAIARLKSDLEVRSQEVLALQVEIEKMREENKQLTSNVTQRDSSLASREEVIQLKEQDIAELESLVTDINEQTKVKVANLYFAQAQALETAAKRTSFLAARKKKETKREALELYKLSFSLGKAEAEQRINKLEKDLS